MLHLGFIADIIWGVSWRGFSKISRAPQARFAFCIKNKLFQIKARSMVHTRGPGKIGLVEIFVNEVLEKT